MVRVISHGLTGRIKLYNAGKGYGFLVSSDAPGDVFFHRSDCRTDPSTLEPGAEVAFDLVEMANGQVKAVRLGTRIARPRLRQAMPAGAASGPHPAGL